MWRSQDKRFFLFKQAAGWTIVTYSSQGISLLLASGLIGKHFPTRREAAQRLEDTLWMEEKRASTSPARKIE